MAVGRSSVFVMTISLKARGGVEAPNIGAVDSTIRIAAAIHVRDERAATANVEHHAQLRRKNQ
jgi:hypothetical protein